MSDRRLIAQIGAQSSWAKTPDRSARTAPARAAADQRFERQVDPRGELDPADRAIRAAHAKKAFYLTLALKSAQVRRAKSRLADLEAEVAAEIQDALGDPSGELADVMAEAGIELDGAA